MFTQSISHPAPRLRIGLGTVLTALGVLVTVAVVITMLGVSTKHPTVASPAPASQVAGSSTPQVHYLGPRQEHAALSRVTSGVSSAAGASHPAARYSCLGAAQRCLR